MSTQDKHRTNRTDRQWPSCESVTLRDGKLYCRLDRKRTYVLAEAYEDNLHVRFANANSDDELMDFIRAWGPLYIPDGPAGLACLSLADCRAYQRQVKALLVALTAFKWGKNEREALVELMKADSGEDFNLFALKREFGIEGSELDWAVRAPLPQVRAAANSLIESVVGAQFPLRISFDVHGNRRRVVAGWNFTHLLDALLWMVWYDIFTKHPVVCCAECRTIFRGEDARPRKYCSEKCGHKATAREAMRKKRAAQRTGRK